MDNYKTMEIMGGSGPGFEQDIERQPHGLRCFGDVAVDERGRVGVVTSNPIEKDDVQTGMTASIGEVFFSLIKRSFQNDGEVIPVLEPGVTTDPSRLKVVAEEPAWTADNVAAAMMAYWRNAGAQEDRVFDMPSEMTMETFRAAEKEAQLLRQLHVIDRGQDQ